MSPRRSLRSDMILSPFFLVLLVGLMPVVAMCDVAVDMWFDDLPPQEPNDNTIHKQVQEHLEIPMSWTPHKIPERLLGQHHPPFSSPILSNSTTLRAILSMSASVNTTVKGPIGLTGGT